MLPNFLVVGAAKCGTTSLFHYLIQHPDVFIPEKKECFFFSQLKAFTGPRNDQEINNALVHSLDEYERLFDTAAGALFRGDVSHDYLYYYERSIPNILEHLGRETPIIIILRDPRERAFSHYKHHLKAGASPDRSFAEALAREEERIRQGWSWNWHYVHAGLYADKVQAYMETFTQVRVYLFDDLAKDAAALVRDLYGFIGANPRFEPGIHIENQGVSIRSNRLNRFLRNEGVLKQVIKQGLRLIGLSPQGISRLKRRAMAANVGEKERLNPATRGELTSLFIDDLKRLERLIGADLSHWYS